MQCCCNLSLFWMVSLGKQFNGCTLVWTVGATLDISKNYLFNHFFQNTLKLMCGNLWNHQLPGLRPEALTSPLEPILLVATLRLPGPLHNFNPLINEDWTLSDLHIHILTYSYTLKNHAIFKWTWFNKLVLLNHSSLKTCQVIFKKTQKQVNPVRLSKSSDTPLNYFLPYLHPLHLYSITILTANVEDK